MRWPRTYPGWWFKITGEAYNEAGEYQGAVRGSESPNECTFVKIVLTVAHLNHVPGEDDDENLAALCQRCHLKHDRQHHKETRAKRKDAARPILAAIEEALPDETPGKEAAQNPAAKTSKVESEPPR